MTIDGLVSRDDLNGRRGTILGFTDGRYNVQVRGAGGQAVRIKPGNLTPTSDVDARELAPWPGLSCGPIVVDMMGASYGALEHCFQNAMPGAAKAAFQDPATALKALELAKARQPGTSANVDKLLQDMLLSAQNRKPADLAPEIQWLYSLLHMVKHLEEPPPCGPTARFVLLEDLRKDPALSTTPCLVIDFLGPPLACPESVPATKKYAHRGKALENEVAPLLEVRYMPLRAADRKRVLDERQLCTMGLDDAIYKSAFDRFGWQQANRENLVHVFAASSDEIKAAREHLDRMAATYVSSSYSEHFYSASSCHHRTAKASFRCSFVVPPSESLLLPPTPRTDMLCQAVSERPASELSVCFSLKPDQNYLDKAPYSMTMSLQDGRMRAGKTETGVPRNIHGAAEFIVKIQAPLGMTDDRRHIPGNGPFGFLSKRDSESLGQPWNCMVYDRERSFTHMLPADTPGVVDHILSIIAKEGPKHPTARAGCPGIKGYFKAIREGDNLRVFCKMVEPQPW